VCMTPGILLRRIQADPFLEGVGAVVFDEFHERGVDADLALALVADVRREANPELQVVVMSATLEAEKFQTYFVDAPLIKVPGR